MATYRIFFKDKEFYPEDIEADRLFIAKNAVTFYNEDNSKDIVALMPLSSIIKVVNIG